MEARKLTAQTIIDEEAMMSKASEPANYFPAYRRCPCERAAEVVWSGVSGQISSWTLCGPRDKKMRAEFGGAGRAV